MAVTLGRSLLGWAAWPLALASLGVHAQAITPGGVQDTLKKAPPLAPPAQPLPTLRDTMAPAAEKRILAPAEQAKTITVNRFEFSGNTLYSGDELSPLVADYTSRPITLEQLYEAADKVTAFYVQQGYTLAAAVVPAQKVTEGTVRLEVIEGRIGQVKYEGLKRYEPSDLTRYLGSVEGKFYRASVFEQNLRSVDLLPGLDVRARLQPGEQYGSSDIVVSGKETLFEGLLFTDNGGTENIGVIRTGGQLTVNNPLGIADQLSLSGLRSREGLLKYGAATYSLPTGLDASRLSLTYGYAEFDVAGSFKGVSGTNRNWRGEINWPLRNTGIDRFNVSAAVSHVQADTDFSGVSFNRNKVTLLEVAGNYAYTHANRSVSQAALVLASNFKSEKDPAPDTTAVPFKVDLDLQQLTPLPLSLQLLTRAQFVYGLDPLPDTQKFSIGGPATLRSYAPSEARGDWGYLGQLTLRRNFLLGSALLSPHIFYELGEVRQHQSDRFAPGSGPQDVSLAGYGFGADASYRGLSVKMDYAIPTTDAPVSDGKEDGRFYGTLSLAF